MICTTNIAFLGVTIILSINTFCSTLIIVFPRISHSTTFIFPPLKPSTFFSMCKCCNTSYIFWFYNADPVRNTIQPLSFNSQLWPITCSICVLLELHTSIILYFWDIRQITAREMRPLGRNLRLVLVIRYLMALFLFLIWILMFRLYIWR